MKLLNIHRLDFDVINFDDIITHDKLDDYIKHYINLITDQYNVYVLNIIKTNEYVNIQVRYPSGFVDWMGFNIQIIDTDYLNKFERGE
jgi:hypothetical protein